MLITITALNLKIQGFVQILFFPFDFRGQMVEKLGQLYVLYKLLFKFTKPSKEQKNDTIM